MGEKPSWIFHSDIEIRVGAYELAEVEDRPRLEPAVRVESKEEASVLRESDLFELRDLPLEVRKVGLVFSRKIPPRELHKFSVTDTSICGHSCFHRNGA